MLGFKVSVSNIPKTNQELTNCYVNVYKNILPISPTTKLSTHDIGLSHFAKESIRDANEIISVRHHRTNGALIDVTGSIGIKSNFKPSPNKWIRSVVNNFKYPSLNLLITGVFNELNEPLFWRHELPLAAFDNGVSITDQNGNIVPANKYKLLKEANALVDTHDSLRTVVAHYLNSEPEKNKYYLLNYKDSSGVVVQEILDARPLFTKYPSTASIYTWSQNPDASLLHYWINLDASLYQFQLPDDYGELAFREYDTSYIRSFLPPSLGPNEPWFALVPNFNWIRQDESLFNLPEFQSQNFLGVSPYIEAIDDVSTVLGKHLIQVSNRGPLASYSLNNQTYYIKLLLFQENDDLPTKAITNDSSLDGRLVNNDNDLTWTYTPLSVIDDQAIIYSPIDLGYYSWCYASYVYEASYMPIYLKDLNPFRNTSLRGNTVVYYLVPNFQGQERSIEYLIYDEDLVVISSSQDGINSNNPSISNEITVGLLYDLPEGYREVDSGDNTLGLFVNVVGNTSAATFIETYSDYIILGEFSFPETLDESANSLITDIREKSTLDPIDVKIANPDGLSVLEDSIYNELIQIPSLIGVQEYRCHWAFFSDFNTSALYSKEALEERLNLMKKAGVTSVVTYEGVPTINVKSFDIVNKTLTINWLPIPGFSKDVITSGILYQGTIPSDITTQVASIADLAKLSEYQISYSSNDELYFKIIPQVTINSITYSGPESNVLYFSFKR